MILDTPRQSKKLPVHRLLPLVLLLTLSVAAVVFANPEPAFAFHVSLGTLSLYSDRPFDRGRGEAVLADVQRRLQASASR